MKKTVLLLFIISLASVHSVFCQEIGKKTETKYWEFMKERLFDGQTSIVDLVKGDITIDVDGATKYDSLILNNLMLELRTLIPNREISYFKYDLDNRKANKIPTITLSFGDYNRFKSNVRMKRSPRVNGNQVLYEGFNSVYQRIHIYLNDTVSYSQRKRYIEYAMVRSLCTIRGNASKADTFIDSAILNRFDYDPAGTKFTDADRFLIRKLYSLDFNKAFRAFMISNYSWQYYMRYTNKATVQSMQYSITAILVLIIFILSYRPVLTRKYKRKYLGYLIPGLLIANFSIATQFIFYFLTSERNFSYSNAAIIQWGFFLLFFFFAINLLAAVLSLILYFVERHLITPTTRFEIQLALKVLLLFVVSLIPSLMIFFAPFSLIGIESIIVLGTSALVLPIGRATVLFLNHLSESRVRQKDVELSRLRELKAQAEIKSFQARINPHFLYNSLNSIAGLAHSNPDKTEKMALALSDLFRYSINRNGNHMSSIQDEVTMVRCYLEIEQIRFGERMDFRIQVDEDLQNVQIPRFILQPLVENAIKHGISKIEGRGEITLSITKNEEGLVITVTDNGPGFPEGLVSGYGLQSLFDLLKLTYGDQAEINWQNVPEKKIWVNIKTIAVHNKYEHTSI